MAQITKITKSGLTVTIDQDLCIGAASCVAVAPTVWQLNSNGKAEFVDADSVSDDMQMQAAKSCPVNAIIIKDKNGNVVWPR